METSTDHRSLIDDLGGSTEVVRMSGENWRPVTVGQWKLQNRIPPEYWPKFIELAAEKGITGINSSWFMRTWPSRKNAMVGSPAEAGSAA